MNFYLVRKLQNFNVYYNHKENKAIILDVIDNSNLINLLSFMNINFFDEYNDDLYDKVQDKFSENDPNIETLFISKKAFLVKNSIIYNQGEMQKFGKIIN